MHCACAILSSVACLNLRYFSTLSHKWQNFRKTIAEHKMCVLISSTTAFLKLWSADHKWSSGSALVVILDWTLVKKKTEKIKLTWIAYHTLQLRTSNRVWKLHTTSVFKLSLPGLTFYEIYYPTYSTLINKRGIFCCKNMFGTLFRAGLMSLIIPRVGWSVEHSD